MLFDWEGNGLELVAEAMDGKEAVLKACIYKPDIILMDINMPKMNGLNAIREIINLLPQCVIIIINGAGSLRTFFRITLPLCRSSHFTLFLLGALGTLKCFDIPFVLTKGGPNYATEFFSTYIYKKSFDLWDQGGASTLVVIMFLIALCVTFAQLRIYLRGNRKKGMD